MAIKQQLLDQIAPLVNAYGLLDRNEMFKTSINSMLEQFKIDSFSMEDWKQEFRNPREHVLIKTLFRGDYGRPFCSTFGGHSSNPNAGVGRARMM
jgi:hypothetical protein